MYNGRYIHVSDRVCRYHCIIHINHRGHLCRVCSISTYIEQHSMRINYL